MDDHPARALPGAAAGGGLLPAGLLELDGSAGEGGGQRLRSALTLSMCTGRPFRMRHIRAGRERPGLLRQHVACVTASQAVSGGSAEGADVGSTEVAFSPGEVRAGDHVFGVGSAGSCTLVLQTVWPALMALREPTRIMLRGGTHNPGAPPFHFIDRAYAPLMRRLGSPADLRLRRHGFYPTGGGGIEVVLPGSPDGTLKPFDLLDRGSLLSGYAECLVAAVPRHVGARELDTLGRALGWSGEQLRLPLVRQNEGPGNALMVTLEHEHLVELFTAFGEKGVSAETVARNVVREVRAYTAGHAALGPWLADQWMLPLAIAVWRTGVPAGFTCSGLSPHARSNLELIGQFLPVTFRTSPVDTGWRVDIAA